MLHKYLNITMYYVLYVLLKIIGHCHIACSLLIKALHSVTEDF